jgi:hypothetical protein
MSIKDKLENQKLRAQKLNYKDKKELDDIISKTKLYVKQLFPLDLHQLELGLISFKPTSTIYGNDSKQNKNEIDAWQEGKDKLINFIDTRLEEYELTSIKKKPDNNISIPVEKIIYKDKIVKVENTDRINDLENKLRNVQNKKNIWQKINWATFLTISIAVLGGTFLFGKYIGENRFDNDKIKLYESNKSFETENKKLQKANSLQGKEILKLKSLIPKETSIKESNTLKISVSESNPISIFDGQIFISAKEEINSTLLTFKGTKGVSKSVDGNFDSNTIKVNKGDRFYLKDMFSTIWTINVFDTTLDVDLELFPGYYQ